VSDGLVRRFGESNVVDGIDLVISTGEIYGFLGPNGAGKSTMVRMLTTLLLPTAGTATVAGYDVIHEPHEVRLRIGAALQEASLDSRQTGRELLRLQGSLYGLSRREIDRRMVDLEQLVDIGDAMDRLVGTYSGGMKRRLDLAAALVHNPQVLFLDEPTTGLDPISRVKVWEEVRRINKDLGVTIFLLTQYLEEADALTNRIGIINRGRLVAEGTPTELKRSVGSDVIIARIDGDSIAATEALGRITNIGAIETHGDELTIAIENGAAFVSRVALALNDSGVAVRELTLRSPTLDDVFLHFTGARLEEAETAPEESKE
jgi:ABC-2 type transport system ATP-binding protein